MMIKKIALLLLIAFALGSCVSKKKIVYMQNISTILPSERISYEPSIQPDDLLVINVFSPTPEAVVRFNLLTAQTSQSTNVATGSSTIQDPVFYSYLVDVDGNIHFPIIGDIKLGGLTKTEAIAKLNAELGEYITNPIAIIRIINFKVSVLGEVNSPGEVTLVSERITLPEVISKAGDLTIYGKRENVLIIREINGQKTFNFVDLTKADFINSPFYYLTQNDMVIVEPNKTKVNSAVIGPNTGVIFSAISILLTVVALLIR
jgi:polysaccharide export outer membrane protein